MALKPTAVLLVALAATPVTARAQDAGHGFLFGAPVGSFTVRGGWALARAHAICSRSRRNSSRSIAVTSAHRIEADLAFRVAARTDVVVSTGFSGMGRRSEFRHFIDNNDLPIEQTTAFTASRLRSASAVSHVDWTIDRSIQRGFRRALRRTSEAAVAMYYRFRQEGDFIDLQTTNVFPSIYASDGWTRTAYAAAGLDYSLGPASLTTEARYSGPMPSFRADFIGFERLDLSGLSTTVGVAVRF
jgi:hypothetical protein